MKQEFQGIAEIALDALSMLGTFPTALIDRRTESPGATRVPFGGQF
jgi:hypothetical protein